MLYRQSKHSAANVIVFALTGKAVIATILQSVPSLMGSAMVITKFTIAFPLHITATPISVFIKLAIKKK